MLQHHRPWIFVALVAATALVSVLTPIRSSGAQSPARQTTNLIVTVLDPLGDPASGIPLLFENASFQIPFFTEGRTDRNGQFRLRVPPGSYLVTAPVEFFPAVTMRVPAGEVVEQIVRMQIDTTTATFSVCIDCPDSPGYKPPPSVVEDFQRDRDASLSEVVSGAEPDVGWEFYQPRASDALRQLGASAPVGTVVVEARITTEGNVRDIRVVSPADPILASAATSTLGNTRWRPARVRKAPVDVPLRVTFVYKREGD